MHADIQAFWRYKGYTITMISPISSRLHYWTAMKEGEQTFFIAQEDIMDPSNNTYKMEDDNTSLFVGTKYSEEEVLRRIKLSAFL
jgi:hypothetical protein